MKGAIIGDIIGSRFEAFNIKTKDFELFDDSSEYTDDTVLTVAIADSILNGEPYEIKLKQYAQKYPYAGYGATFFEWMRGRIEGPYNSWGNGSAMRVSAVGWAFDNATNVLKEAKLSAEVTHNHREGIKGARATSLAIFMAKKGKSKTDIKAEIIKRFRYDLNRTIDDIRPVYEFDVSCQGSVPEAIIAFLESESYEDAIRNAISIGGDSDTIACIAGGIAEAFYKEIPMEIQKEAMKRLPMNFIDVIAEFEKKYMQ